MEYEYQELPKTEPTPFDNIGLSFSGGGFRAASFGLGVLSYLEQLPLEDGTPILHRVSFMSSTSGGTIPNALYALNSAQGKTFEEFYKKLHQQLEGTSLLDKVFKILNDDHEWNIRPHKRRNIINAFALTYDRELFDAALLEELNKPNSSTHLEEVCFNATEFYRGLLFRQNVKMKPDSQYRHDSKYRYGNFAISLGYKAAKQLKLSDLLAASSCFPAGFEPIIFPDDFTYGKKESESSEKEKKTPSLTKRFLLDHLKINLMELDRQEFERLYGQEATDNTIGRLSSNPSIEELKDAFQKLPLSDDLKFGIMDGGVTDNQALESLTDAQERRNSQKTDFKPFDLMLINDVSSHYMDPYLPPKVYNSYTGIQGITINTALLSSALFLIAGIALTVACFLPFFAQGTAKGLLVLGTSTTLLSGLVLAFLLFIRSYIKKNLKQFHTIELEKNFSKGIVNNLFKHFGGTPIGVLIRMAKERFSSVLLLNNDIFLKRIRFLLYKLTYDSKKFSYRIKTNHIYDLAFSNDNNSSNVKKYSPSKELQTVAQYAFEMGTTLWFDQANQTEHKQAIVISCGQFSTCYNLLVYIHRLKTNKNNTDKSYYDLLAPKYKQRVDDLERKLQKEYDKFKEDPFWLYNQLGEKYIHKDFKKCSIGFLKIPKNFDKLR
jgi:hypothetical protein